MAVSPYIYLLVAILSEVTASTALRATAGFTHFWPSLITIAGYALSFYALAQTLEVFSLGLVYAVWSGIGMVLITFLAFWLYDQKLDLAAFIGIGLIIAGVVVINLFSDMVIR